MSEEFKFRAKNKDGDWLYFNLGECSHYSSTGKYCVWVSDYEEVEIDKKTIELLTQPITEAVCQSSE